MALSPDPPNEEFCNEALSPVLFGSSCHFAQELIITNVHSIHNLLFNPISSCAAAVRGSSRNVYPNVVGDGDALWPTTILMVAVFE